MDGMHDLGGMHGFGPVPIEQQNYVFRYDWQRRAFALVQALASPTPYCADQHRQEIERIQPLDYLRLDYFERWVIATEALIEQAGLVSRTELATGKQEFSVDLAKHRPVSSAELIAAMKAGVRLAYPPETKQPRFAAGQAAKVRLNCSEGHTRVPRYLRGHIGRVVADTGVFQFADAVAAGRGPSPERCYTLVFSARLLWGDATEVDDDIYADLWEPYLEPA